MASDVVSIVPKMYLVLFLIAGICLASGQTLPEIRVNGPTKTEKINGPLETEIPLCEALKMSLNGILSEKHLHIWKESLKKSFEKEFDDEFEDEYKGLLKQIPRDQFQRQFELIFKEILDSGVTLVNEKYSGDFFEDLLEHTFKRMKKDVGKHSAAPGNEGHKEPEKKKEKVSKTKLMDELKDKVAGKEILSEKTETNHEHSGHVLNTAKVDIHKAHRTKQIEEKPVYKLPKQRSEDKPKQLQDKEIGLNTEITEGESPNNQPKVNAIVKPKSSEGNIQSQAKKTENMAKMSYKQAQKRHVPQQSDLIKLKSKQVESVFVYDQGTEPKVETTQDNKSKAFKSHVRDHDYSGSDRLVGKDRRSKAGQPLVEKQKQNVEPTLEQVQVKLSQAQNIRSQKPVKGHVRDHDLTGSERRLAKNKSPRKEGEGVAINLKEKLDSGIKGKDIKAGEVNYVGAVLEFEPYSEWSDTEKGQKVIRENANTIVSYAAQAKSQLADILIIPEYGLQSLNTFDSETEKFLTFGQYVPEPGLSMAPCFYANDTFNYEAMHILSCGALDNQIYLVVDIQELVPCSVETIPLAPWELEPTDDCPVSGYNVYNTQAVFDRTGNVIARYRKQHLFNEDAFTPGPLEDQTALFLTDFDVLFSLQICFDIVFEHPGYNNVKTIGLKDVAMSTAWVDYLPFALADSIQNGWSRGLGINLLVAGYHNPEKSKMGSGIYRGYSGELPVYTYDKNSGNVLLVANVTTVSGSGLQAMKMTTKSASQDPFKGSSWPTVNSEISEEDRTHVIVHENLENYTAVIIPPLAPGGVGNISACSYDNFCCDLTYSYSGGLVYQFLAYSGQFAVSEGRYPVGIQTCAVIWCKSEFKSSCALVELGVPPTDFFGPFEITSNTFAIDSIYPLGNTFNLTLINNDILQYKVDGTKFTLTATEPVEDLLMSALYGRWYNNDGYHM